MRRGDVRGIEWGEDGERTRVRAEYLGKGHFCRGAWRVLDGPLGGRVILYVDKEDYSKEVFTDGPCSVDPGPHFPRIKAHGQVNRRGVWLNVYESEYVRTVSGADTEAWAILQTLQKARETAWAKGSYGYAKPLSQYGAYLNADIIEASRGVVPESVTAALQDLADAACNYGVGMTFEFAPRNTGVRDDGSIVFRDCLFDAEKIERAFARRRWLT